MYVYVYACILALERQWRPEEGRDELTSSCELSDVGAENGRSSLEEPSFSSPIHGETFDNMLIVSKFLLKKQNRKDAC